jgi:pimeloyl-ACP methyl ester carboxylesterase
MLIKHQTAIFLTSLMLSVVAWSAQAASVTIIVFVHGAFVDGSGWQSVYDLLVNDGYHVSVVQQPLTSLEDDVRATTRILDKQSWACILVGHSYGCAVITEAGIHPKVAGLVYVAAYALDIGETEVANRRRFPNSAHPLVKTSDGFLFLDPANFAEDFAADLPRDQAEFIAHAVMLTAATVFSTPITKPVWKEKPSWYLVPKADKMINLDLERMYAKRAHSHMIEVEGASHAVYVSHPNEVVDLIEEASKTAEK